MSFVKDVLPRMLPPPRPYRIYIEWLASNAARNTMRGSKYRPYVLMGLLGSLTFCNDPRSGREANTASPSSSTLWVSLSGSDAHDGSESHPVRTFEEALRRATPGTTIRLGSNYQNEGYNDNELVHHYVSSVDGFLFDGTTSEEARNKCEAFRTKRRKDIQGKACESLDHEHPTRLCNGFAIVVDGVNGEPDRPITLDGNGHTLFFDGAAGISIFNSKHIVIQNFVLEGPVQINLSAAKAHRLDGFNFVDVKLEGLSDEYLEKTRDYREYNENRIVCTNAPGESTPYYTGQGVQINRSTHVTLAVNALRAVPSAAIKSLGSDWVKITRNRVLHTTRYTRSGASAISVDTSQDIGNGDPWEFRFEIVGNELYENYNMLPIFKATQRTDKPPYGTIDEPEVLDGRAIYVTRNKFGRNDNDVEYVRANGLVKHGAMLIMGNIIYRSGLAGISVHFTDRVTVRDNILYDNGFLTKVDGARVNDQGINLNFSHQVRVMNNVIWSTPGADAIRNWVPDRIESIKQAMTDVGLLQPGEKDKYPEILTQSNIIYNGSTNFPADVNTYLSEEDPTKVFVKPIAETADQLDLRLKSGGATP